MVCMDCEIIEACIAGQYVALHACKDLTRMSIAAFLQIALSKHGQTGSKKLRQSPKRMRSGSNVSDSR